MTSILVADDDPHIRELVEHFLKAEGMNVYGAGDGEAALELLAGNGIDLAVIDIMMPKMDGWELCRRLREQYDLPILMLTAKGETSQIVKGFELGTDDYLVKPFEPPVLIARVKALLKRYQISAAQSVSVGKLRMNRKTYEIFSEFGETTLPLKEYELLFKLASYPGQTLTRDRLIEEIWGFDFEGNERTLDVHIGRLRERFPSEQYGFAIRTIRGLGYRLEIMA
ncbi:response regulator transcription factor [Paenibacillus sp. NFR01]|uniref:response regulator transcription factor n=1 Tax=Paenibacillus sp. NFR01 TaxID=1566279 RepID=UPI0008AEB072|nr:response regulator transcription factor [Paenibacillus sp. NFR01]SEU12996.1 DNA-binding response regulator, OmpR family, contains REC and winged-helix (wHTH) domain [Paenibacillus sp. NFR01]